jgi:EAL domain-containing protein (putative c-di-GMP-specific phosphodiesterase class I)
VRALVVDDDELLLDVYSTFLREIEFETDTAGRAEEALACVSKQSYDVILSDIQMPGMSGVEFLKAIRRLDLDVPVILMTGAPSIDSAIEALEYGAFRYLRKPVPQALLEETVKRAASYRVLARLKRDALDLTGRASQWPADRAGLEGRFDSALARLWVAFQPIVSFRARRVHAYEALMRSDEPTLRGPGEILEAAEMLGRLHDLGRVVRQRVGAAAPTIPGAVRLFVNLHPVDLDDPQLIRADGPLASIASRVVFEVTERAALHHVVSLHATVAALREMQYRLAVDDLGAGYAGLTSMAQLEPEYVKLDMSLVRGIHQNVTQQRLVRSMVEVCRDLGKDVIAEGVEEAAERDALLAIGCDLLQGYLFARPARELPPVDWGT